MDNKGREERPIIFRNNLKVIPNIYDLEKVGAGHDGEVFRYGNKALKLLKYDIDARKIKKLMTFNKAVFFQDELELKRIVKPTDILLDIDGVYTGYVMDFLDDVTLEKKKGTPLYKVPADFTCGELVHASYELSDDFSNLTKNKVVARDLNRGSYIFTSNFMHICDMDKYSLSCQGADDLNKKALNFVIAKFLYYEMLKKGNYDKTQSKMLLN